ncbi:hypothetical protein [Miniphocaeibacter halophilus]|uniref:Uncharacterized protein n=1 Tax=Miniphocaeibacter halophilus TaxID=2931922 RepID=A0AC61MMK3_9FIRM|nr:hypothetical protein [Miniphocaeibacter halophilus]QQK06909.1 hypothetical protein JFY71_06050 [Miniphocaeibacter halophilus]
MKKNNDYYSSIHRLGRISTLIVIILMFMIPIVTMFVFNIKVDWKTTLAAAAQLCIVFIPTQFTEVVSFSPILGSGGTYLSFVTGNVSNMKLPAASSCHKMAKVDPSSDEGEVISVLAIGASSIVTAVILFLGIFLLSPVVKYLQSDIIQPGFNNIMPALVGAMLMPYLLKKPKIAVVPFLIALIAGIILPAATYSNLQGFLLLGTMVISVISVIVMNRERNIR